MISKDKENIIFSQISVQQAEEILAQRANPHAILLRESSVPGLITLTFLQNKKTIKHTRFAYINGQWIATPALNNSNTVSVFLASAHPFFTQSSFIVNNQEVFSLLLEKIRLEYGEGVIDLITPAEVEAVCMATTGYSPDSSLTQPAL